MSGTKFALPCKPQSRSKLVAIPAELRLKILRYLLKDNFTKSGEGAIFSSLNEHIKLNQDTGTFTSSSDGGSELSSQVLATCQTLHSEAFDVLYGENTLNIEIASKYMKKIEISIQGSRIVLPAVLESYGDGPFDLESTCSRQSASILSKNQSDAVGLHQTLSRLKKFISFQLVLAYDTSDEVAVVARLLKTVLQAKEIVVFLRPSLGRERQSHRLIPFELLRCKSIKFADISATDQRAMDEIATDITSQTESTDHYPTAKEIIQVLKSSLPPIGVRLFHEENEKSLRYLEDCAASVSMAWMFEAQRRDVLAAAEAWQEEWIEQERRDAQRKIGEASQSLSASEQIGRELEASFVRLKELS